MARIGRKSWRKQPDAPLTEYVGRILERRALSGMNISDKRSGLARKPLAGMRRTADTALQAMNTMRRFRPVKDAMATLLRAGAEPMNRVSQAGHLALAAVLAICALPLLAAVPHKQDEKKLIAKVFSDGTLFGFAKRCQVPEADLKTLYDKQFASSRDFGIAKVPHYSARDFRRDFQAGINTADRFSAAKGANRQTAVQDCTEVREKVQAIISAK